MHGPRGWSFSTTAGPRGRWRITHVVGAVALLLLLLGCSEQPSPDTSAGTPVQSPRGLIDGDSSAESGNEQSGFCPGSVPWNRAEAHVGQTLRVRGPVVGSAYASESNGQPTFLNLGKDYPSPQRFTVVIWGEDRANFPGAPEARYQGAMVCVRGQVSTYEGIPQIFADDPSDIQVAAK